MFSSFAYSSSGLKPFYEDKVISVLEDPSLKRLSEKCHEFNETYKKLIKSKTIEEQKEITKSIFSFQRGRDQFLTYTKEAIFLCRQVSRIRAILEKN